MAEKLQLFHPEMIEWSDTIHDWKTAVIKGVEILVRHNKATAQLANAIFATTAKFGPYYVFEGGLALLHAEPGTYALAPATSTLILKDNVIFADQADKQARIIITMAAPDNNSHMDLIAEFSQYFTDEQTKAAILKVQSLAEFKKIIKW
ncbi:PTS system ascorbate-specific IIA component [Mycoplasmoides fastidiosum]|uniref:Ascorbate-specific PTS system EIIA component n=1 Tax=Mycoplasmoides fastidiosum TaxID=92758 RepID=A0ABU0LZ29_9BACT|nr:PTS sugar transporter subunit IIA [Mycoplasmoides fastidiosum]MDQ0513957.1 PTS system ascorbate-specific IIA component [Mycoplasmoides fastidiosum]UUD37629.1 PTS sugar transporter subunit IIA [Mycoplasmoides fastidiosum]